MEPVYLYIAQQAPANIYSCSQNSVPIQFLTWVVAQQMTLKFSVFFTELVFLSTDFSEHIFVICYNIRIPFKITPASNKKVRKKFSGLF